MVDSSLDAVTILTLKDFLNLKICHTSCQPQRGLQSRVTISILKPFKTMPIFPFLVRWGILFKLISQFLYLSAQMQSIPNDSRINCLKLHPSRGDPPKDIFCFLKCHKSSFISVWCLKINEACSALVFRDLRDYVKKLFPPKHWQRCTNTV